MKNQIREQKKLKLKELEEVFNDEIYLLNLQKEVIEDSIINSETLDELNNITIEFDTKNLCLCHG